MLTSSRILCWGLAVVSGGIMASHGMAKGLSELSQSNPANEADKFGKPTATDDHSKSDKEVSSQGQGTAEKQGVPTDQKPAVAVEKGEVSKALAGRLVLGTSYGWIMGSRSTGKWSAKGGMSDVTLGYKWRTFGKAYDAIGTYRYAPMSIHGEQDTQSYRGVWEAHYFGGKFARQVKNILTFGSLEVGYVSTHVQPIDGLPESASAQDGGFSLAFGGGADFKVLDQLLFGPRVHLAVGSIRTVQLAGAASFAF